jgi:hypothetical protein
MNVKYINKAQDVPLKVALVFLILLTIVGIILLIAYEKQASDCKNLESPLCLTGNCAGKSSACNNAPFKTVNGNTVCKASLVNQQQIPLVQFSTPS